MRKLGVLRLVLVLILALVPVPGMCSFVAAAVSQVLEVANPDTTYWVSYNGQAPWANCKGATPLNGTEACALSTANANASAGDTVYLRGGTYSGQEIRPVNSGISESARLVFTSYAQEEVLIRDAAYGIYIYKQSYITVNGINFYSLRRFFRIYAGHYNTISACDFDTRSPQSGDWAGAIIADDPNDDTPASENSTYNWVHHCTFYRWVYGAYDEHRGGLLDIGSWAEAPVDESDYNLIENNVFAYGGHHTLGVYSRYNVIRNNYIHNETNPTNWDFEGYRGAITEGPAAGYNLYAGNRFGFADASGLALRSRHNILRFNTFYHNGSGGIQVVSSAAGQDHADYNRIYHNTFYHNGHLATDPGFQGGMYFANWSNQSPVGNVVKNNIFYDNKNGPVTYEGQIDPQVVENNWDQNDLNPGFVALSGSNPDDPSLPDLRLESASPAIDEGIWLTTITSAGGSGAAFSVADAGYFTDGWDVVEGDLIQLANGRRARILDVNYETNTLTVDTTLSWTQGMGISLAYRGAAPDLGAYEFEPELTLRGAPGDGVIHLDWRVNTALPVSATWTINYETPNSVYLPITGLTNTLRAHILTNLTNYVWYTVTLHAMDGATAIMSDTVRVMPTDKRVYLPLVLKSGQRFALDRATELSAGYALAVEAEHGYVVKQLDQEGNAGGQMMRLIARPAAGYKFARWEGAATGTQPVAEVAMTGAKTVRAVFEAWAPPIGIPAPAFGIFETYRMYDNVAKRNSVLTYTQNTEGGYYTHYVNPNHPQATNTHNPYGTASKPRTTLPSAANVPEGSVIEIGGDTTLTGQLIFQVVGTAERPIFVRGADPANPVKLTGGELYLRSAYLILENISRPDESLTVRSSAGVARAHHISVRNSTLWRAGALSWDGDVSEDIVFYGNEVNGHAFDPAAGEFPENDGFGGIGINLGSNRVWIVDNVITRAGGDAVGGGHAANYTASNYYIGRNVLSTCGENAVDIKEVENVVVSQNVMYDYQGWSSGSDGTAVVVHYGPTYSPKNVWILFNEIYDAADKGIQVGGDQEYDVYVIGNLIHDIHNAAGTGVGYRTWSSNQVYFVGNVFYNLDNGLQHDTEAQDAQLILYNNIIANVGPSGYHLLVGGSGQRAAADIGHNLFYQPGADVRIDWGSQDYNVVEFQAATGKCQGCLEADPLFVDAAHHDFHLQSASPARDAGVLSALYRQFEDFFGADIRLDFDGVPRPQGGGWDIGAYEFTPALALRGAPSDRAIRLTWDVNGALPVSATWTINYETPGSVYLPITGILSPTRAYTLTDLTNYVWYTVTLNAMLDATPILTDTAMVMPTDIRVCLPLVLR